MDTSERNVSAMSKSQIPEVTWRRARWLSPTASTSAHVNDTSELIAPNSRALALKVTSRDAARDAVITDQC